MYTQSTARRASVAAVLAVALAAIVATSHGTVRPAGSGTAANALPQLPEVVVAAARLPS